MDDRDSGLCWCGCGWAGDESIRRWRQELRAPARPAPATTTDAGRVPQGRSSRLPLLRRLTLLR